MNVETRLTDAAQTLQEARAEFEAAILAARQDGLSLRRTGELAGISNVGVLKLQRRLIAL